MKKEATKGIQKEGKPAVLSDRQRTITVPPDGGWGWVILVIAFGGNFCCDAGSLSFASIQDFLAVEFQKSTVQITLIVSIFNCIFYLIGPIDGALANKFGFKCLMLCGGAIAGSGFVMCYWAMNYFATMFTYSLFGGVGASFFYMGSSALPGYWFEEKRSLAFGLASSSTGIVAVVIPTICQQIIEDLGWKYVYFFLGGLYFFVFLLVLLIRDPPMAVVEVDEDKLEQIEQGESSITLIDKNRPVTMSILAVGGGNVDEKIRRMSLHPGISVQRLGKEETDENCCKRCLLTTFPCMRKKTTVERPMYKTDIFYQGNTDKIIEKYKMQPSEYTLSVHRLPTNKDLLEEGRCVICPEAIQRPIREMMDFSLLKSKLYITVAINTLMYYWAVYIPFMYIPRVLTSKGVSQGYAKVALALFGVGMTMSRLLIGVLFIVFPKLKHCYVCCFSIGIGGLSCILITAFRSAPAGIFFSFLTGFFSGVWVPLRSVLLVRYIGLSKLTSAMGLLFMVQAAGSLGGVPTAEMAQETFHDVNVLLYISGGLWILCAIQLMPTEAMFVKGRAASDVEETAVKSDVEKKKSGPARDRL